MHPMLKHASASELLKIAEGDRTWTQFLVGDSLNQAGNAGSNLMRGNVSGAIGNIGTGMANTLDPMNRGFVQDALLYSNPFSGVPTAANDAIRHMWNGRWGSALGSVGMGALSFLPGAGGAGGAALKGAVKGTAGAAARAAATRAGGRGITNALASAGRRTGSTMLDDAARGMNNFARGGAKAVTEGQQALTQAGQRIVAPKYTQWEHGFRTPMQMQNPLSNGAGQWGLRSPITQLQSPINGQTFRNWSPWHGGAAYRSGIDAAIANPAMTSTLFHNYGADPSGQFGPTVKADATARLQERMRPTRPNPYY